VIEDLIFIVNHLTLRGEMDTLRLVVRSQDVWFSLCVEGTHRTPMDLSDDGRKQERGRGVDFFHSPPSNKTIPWLGRQGKAEGTARWE
jgi:hypothetical protein